MIINIPTKAFIKAWIENPQSPDNRKLATDIINILFAETLKRNHGIYKYSYDENIELDIKGWIPKKFNHNASIYRAQEFNRRITDIIRRDIRNTILTYIEFDSSLTRAVEFAYKKHNINEDLYNSDTIKKDFQRYRKRYGGKHFYKKAL